MLCIICQASLKRQVIGSNVFYYCRKCGCVSSEMYLTKEVKTPHIQESISASMALSAEVELSE